MHAVMSIAAIAVALTVWAAYNAYSIGQEASVISSQTKQESYEKAKAKEVLTKIKETGTVKELGKLADKADLIETEAGKKLTEVSARLSEAEAALKKNCAKPWADACKQAQVAQNKAEDEKRQAAADSKQAEAEAKAAHARLSQAEARDEAKRELTEAEAKSEKGGAPKREESQVLMWLAIALTQLAALHGGHGVELIGSGWRARGLGRQQAPLPSPKAKRAAASVEAGQANEPLPANVVPLNGRKHNVEARLRAAVKKGGELKGGEALRAYKRWPEADATMTTKELRAVLQAICGSAVEARTSGYVVRGVELCTTAGLQTKAVAI